MKVLTWNMTDFICSSFIFLHFRKQLVHQPSIMGIKVLVYVAFLEYTYYLHIQSSE